MAVYIVLLASAVVALAAPNLPTVAGINQELNIVFQYNKAELLSSVQAWNKDRTKLFGHSCSGSLVSGTFANYPVHFDVDFNGAGNLTLNATTHKVHEDPNISNGISCGRIYSPNESLVTCTVLVPDVLQFSSLNKREAEVCFAEGHGLAGILDGLINAPTLPAANVSNVTTTTTTTIGDDAAITTAGHNDKRQNPCGIWFSNTVRVGDGNPHQNNMNIQLSAPMDCGGNRCEVGHSESRSITLSWTASAAATQWISAEFDVVSSIGTGNDYTCKGDAGDWLCVWKNQGQTAYTVQNKDSNECASPNYGSPFVMWSPNADGRGSHYYCVHGRDYCRNEGDRWLETDGRAGGP
ncbi:hypothetical protein Sste5346_004693 [Sporothrix stenoceras]|uniref:Uncharacterized protein n=1 Tax=Sporothrix stenoceras TaxID=5173 RepID=A0ABR3Z8A3_9PEZI